MFIKQHSCNISAKGRITVSKEWNQKSELFNLELHADHSLDIIMICHQLCILARLLFVNANPFLVWVWKGVWPQEGLKWCACSYDGFLSSGGCIKSCDY